jgi:hypothetical protein
MNDEAVVDSTISFVITSIMCYYQKLAYNIWYQTHLCRKSNDSYLEVSRQTLYLRIRSYSSADTASTSDVES